MHNTGYRVVWVNRVINTTLQSYFFTFFTNQHKLLKLLKQSTTMSNYNGSNARPDGADNAGNAADEWAAYQAEQEALLVGT